MESLFDDKLCGTMWCFHGFNYAIACACLYDTSMLASMIHLKAAKRFAVTCKDLSLPWSWSKDSERRVTKKGNTCPRD
jgi:hypothetical protein